MKRFGLIVVAAAVVGIPIAFAVLNQHGSSSVPQAISHPTAARQPAKQPRFIRIPNAVVPCRCVRAVPVFKGKARYDPLRLPARPGPAFTASSGSFWQGRISAVHETSITVGHVTCARDAPLDLSNFRVGSLVVVNCGMGKLLGIGTASSGLYTGSVPIAPAGR